MMWRSSEAIFVDWAWVPHANSPLPLHSRLFPLSSLQLLPFFTTGSRSSVFIESKLKTVPISNLPPPQQLAYLISGSTGDRKMLRWISSHCTIRGISMLCIRGIFLSSPSSTIFAIQDCAISSTTQPPGLLKHLFRYHTSPLKLSMADILNKTQQSCLPTLLDRKNVSVTKIDPENKTVEINHHVPVTYPDIFLEGHLSIHGVLGLFSPLDDPQGDTAELDFFQSPNCDSNSESKPIPDFNGTENLVEWNQIISVLSSHGFVSFAIGLHSVIDGILEDGRNLSFATIFGREREKTEKGREMGNRWDTL